MRFNIRYAIICLGFLCLTACDSKPVVELQGNTLSAQLPPKIRQIARLGTVPLEFRVTVNDVMVRQVRVDNERTESIDITVDVPVDQRNNLKIEWFAIDNGTRVLLADFTTVTQPNQENAVVSLYNDSGERFDFDNDGLSNLKEARENRNITGLYDLEVPFQTGFLGAREPLIDGAVDNDTSGEPRTQDENTTFSLRHDGTNLILYVCGQDQELQGDDSLTPENRYWHDDTIFVFLDGADSDSDFFYDGVDDFQLAFVRSTEEMIVSKGSDNTFCTDGTCVTHQFTSFSTQCEYELRVNMPLAELNMTIGEPIGFDIETTDDDNGGQREGSSGWVGFDDQSNLDPSSFGKIVLR